MNSSQNIYAPSNHDDNLGGECVSKYQRQDVGVLLQAPSTEGPNAVVSVNQPHQVDHTSTQVHQPSFHMSSNSRSFIHETSIKSSAIGSETLYASGGQGLSSTFVPPDFKQEKPIGSCDEPTHSNNGPGTMVNGLPAGEEYIRQELIHFENVIKRFNEDSAPAPLQPIHHQTVADRAPMPSVDDNRNQVPETQLGGHHPQSLQLKEIARKSQLAQGQQVMPYMDNQDPQFQRQHATQYALQHPYSTGKYPEGMSVIPNDQQQMLHDPSHPRQFELQYQRALSSQSQLQQQQQQQQQSFYGFPQDSLPSSKLTHMPSQVQQLYSQRFPNQPGLPTSQGAGLVRPTPSHDLARYNATPRSQTQYQRQSSMPPLQAHAFLNSDSQYQQQVGGFQGDQTGFSNPVDLTSTYHYQRRNSFPIYHRVMGQPSETFSHGMHHNLGSSQASLLRGVLQNSSQSIPGDRDSFLVNSNMGLPSSTTMQTVTMQTVPLLTGRPPSANGDLNPGVPRSQHSSIMYRGNVPHQQQSASVLQQGGKFQTSNTRKIPPESSYSVLTGTSVPLRDTSERHSSAASSDAHFSAYSPLNALDKAPSFTSLLEQSAINQGNLETTYTGSIPNLDLLGELLGQ